jgi:hypothetical protein
MGQAVLGIVGELSRVKRGPATEAQWFAAFGHVFGAPFLVALALVSVLPGLASASSRRDGAFGLRLFQAALFGVFFWRHPVPALWIFMLPNVVGGLPRRRGGVAIALLPLLALVVLGTVAWWRGFAGGLWIAGWELAIAALAFALVWAAPPRR